MVTLHGMFCSAFDCCMLCELSSFKGGERGQELDTSKPRKPWASWRWKWNWWYTWATWHIAWYLVYIIFLVCLNLQWYQTQSVCPPLPKYIYIYLWFRTTCIFQNMHCCIVLLDSRGRYPCPKMPPKTTDLHIWLLYTNQSQFSAEHCASWNKGISKHSRNLTGWVDVFDHSVFLCQRLK